MLKYGKHPKTGNLVQIIKRISAHPPLYRCKVIAGDGIYEANYTAEKLERKFDPITRREFNIRAVERRQFTLFDLETLQAQEEYLAPLPHTSVKTQETDL